MEIVIALAVGGAVGTAIGYGIALKIYKQSNNQEINENSFNELEDLKQKLHLEQIEKTKFETEAKRIPELNNDLSRERLKNTDLESRLAATQAAAQEIQRAQNEKIEMLADLRGNIEKEMKNIAVNALAENNTKFIDLANSKFEPIQTTLQKYEQQIAALETERKDANTKLSTELEQVINSNSSIRIETAKLVTALKSSPKTRGRWGEQTLHKVLELSELSQHCDYNTEENFKREGDNLRPDVVINLPGNRHLVVDAKTPLSAYLEAVDASSDDEREQRLNLHVKQVRDHIKNLASKTYWDGLTVTPDFVIMFIPGDNFYTAAVERDPSIFEDAAAQRVIIVTPATLIALAKAVAYGWRQEKVAETAREIHKTGQELYSRLSTMTDHVVAIGKSLNSSVGHYNKFVGSLETKVLPKARRFSELEVEGTKDELKDLEPIDEAARALQPNRDMVMIESNSDEEAA